MVALVVGEGHKNLVEVTVDTDGHAGDATGSVIATEGHPFWVADLNTWLVASELAPGQWLRTSTGTWVQIEAVRPYTQQHRVHNLTITDLHTYYVHAGDTPVLVHNCGTGRSWTPEELAGREKYVQEINGLRDLGETLLEQGASPELVARTLHAQRRLIGERYKNLTPADKLEEVYARNLNKYGDRLGPSIDWLRGRGKDWFDIAESAARTGGKDLGL